MVTRGHAPWRRYKRLVTLGAHATRVLGTGVPVPPRPLTLLPVHRRAPPPPILQGDLVFLKPDDGGTPWAHLRRGRVGCRHVGTRGPRGAVLPEVPGRRSRQLSASRARPSHRCQPVLLFSTGFRARSPLSHPWAGNCPQEKAVNTEKATRSIRSPELRMMVEAERRGAEVAPEP